MTDEERFELKLKAMDARRASQRVERERQAHNKNKVLDKLREVTARLTGKKQPEPAPAEKPRPVVRPDPEPDPETGKYKVHIKHYGLGIEFDMLLDPRKVGAALYHGAIIEIHDKTQVQKLLAKEN